MGERQLGIEQVQKRAEALRPILQRFKGQIEAAEPEARREYVDAFMVYLGLKAVATPMSYVGQYNMDLLTTMYESLPQAERDEHFAIWEFDDGTHCVWNRQLVREIVTENSDLAENRDLGDYSHLLDGQPDEPDENEIGYRVRFVNAMEELNTSGEPADATMEGLLYGIPRPAAEAFPDFLHRAQALLYRVWPTHFPPSIGDIGHNPEVRAEVLRLAEAHEEEDIATLEQIVTLRNADVPGFQYATFGEMTSKEETAISNIWNQLGLAEPVAALFTAPQPEFGIGRRGFQI